MPRPNKLQFRGKKCGKCGGFLSVEIYPQDGDVRCVNCGSTTATWVEGQAGWHVVMQPR